MISFRKSAGPCRGIHTNQTSVSGPARLEHAGSRSKFTQARMKRLKTLKKIPPKTKRSSSRLRNLLLPVLHQDFCKKKRPQLHESSSCMDSWRHMTCIIVTVRFVSIKSLHSKAAKIGELEKQGKNHWACLTETKPQDLDLLEVVGQKIKKSSTNGGEFNGEKSHGRIGSTVFQGRHHLKPETPRNGFRAKIKASCHRCRARWLCGRDLVETGATKTRSS